MGWLEDVIAGWPRAAQHPYPRALIDRPTWRQAIDRLAVGAATMLGLWGENDAVHLALAEEGLVGVLSLACAQRRFPSVARLHPPALRLERTVRDLYTPEAEGAVDRRRWLDHGRWGIREPLGGRQRAAARADGYTFLPPKARGSTSMPSDPCTPASSSPGTSASRSMARRSCASNSGADTRTRASTGR